MNRGRVRPCAATAGRRTVPVAGLLTRQEGDGATRAFPRIQTLGSPRLARSRPVQIRRGRSCACALEYRKVQGMLRSRLSYFR